MNILSIRGGGIKGLIALCILAQLETFFKKTIPQVFDLIVGTSTGGIIACGYGRGLTTGQMISMYIDNSEKIFGRDFIWKLKSGFGVFNSKYNQNGLYEVIFDTFGNHSLVTSKVRVITTTYNTVKQDLFLFDSKDKTDYTFVDACMATSAAPTYFPPWIIDKDNQFIDGGIYAGDPSYIAELEGQKSGKEFTLTSVGTGNFAKRPYFTNNWGIREYLLNYGTSPLTNMSMEGSKQMMAYGNKKRGHDVYDINIPFDIKLDESNKDMLHKIIKYCHQHPVIDYWL